MSRVTGVRDSIEIVARRPVQEEEKELKESRDAISGLGLDVNFQNHKLQRERAQAISKEGRWAGELELVTDDTKYFLVLTDDLAEGVNNLYQIQNRISSPEEIAQIVEKINLMPSEFKSRLIDTVKMFNEAIVNLGLFCEKVLLKSYPNLSAKQSDLLKKIKQGDLGYRVYFELFDCSKLVPGEKYREVLKALRDVYDLRPKLLRPLFAELETELGKIVKEKAGKLPEV